MKKLKYPKITLLLAIIAIVYVIFRNPEISAVFSRFDNLQFFGPFVAGILYSFGFTAPIATGFFLVLNPTNVYITALIGGLGSLLTDTLIYKVIKISFMDEFERLQKTKFIKGIDGFMTRNLHKTVRFAILYVIAMVVIASPLPDELGVMMLAGLTTIKPVPFTIISIMMNTLGILVILLI